jgi:GDP-D-mannose 3',5'-epimerase
LKTALVLGGAGFIGMALTKRLVDEGYWVRAVDIRKPPFAESVAHDFMICDLCNQDDLWDAVGALRVVAAQKVVKVDWDEVYQLAADMGGATYIFTGENDAKVACTNVAINVNIAEVLSKTGCGRLLYTSSSCVYDDLFGDPDLENAYYIDRGIRESDVRFGEPSNTYGWEKLFSERLYDAHRRNYGLNVCITRFSTIYGPGSCFDDGREKAVAAICRKAIDALDGGEVEVLGDGNQVRPYVYIDDLLDAITKLVRSDFNGPVNIANTEETTCDEIAAQAIALSNKRLKIKHVNEINGKPAPIGKPVLRMTTDVAETKLGWHATTPFAAGLEKTFEWIAAQKAKRAAA